MMSFQRCFCVKLSNYRALCGKGNFIHPPTLLTEGNTKSANHCSKWCSQHDTCTGINYHSDGLCQLLTDVLADCTGTQVAVNASITFYERVLGSVCKNGGFYQDGRCFCTLCWAGRWCERYPTSCTESYSALDPALRSNAIKLCTLKPRGFNVLIQAKCHYEYTLIQAHNYQDCPTMDFNKNWKEYKDGFGNNTCFWLGLDNIHYLTNQPECRTVLIVRLRTANLTLFQSSYSGFYIDDDSQGYAAHLTRYFPSAAGDSLISPGGNAQTSINGMKFSTSNNDQDMSSSNCAAVHQAGWWFNDCTSANINGPLSTSPVNPTVTWDYDLPGQTFVRTYLVLKHFEI